MMLVKYLISLLATPLVDKQDCHQLSKLDRGAAASGLKSWLTRYARHSNSLTFEFAPPVALSDAFVIELSTPHHGSVGVYLLDEVPDKEQLKQLSLQKEQADFDVILVGLLLDADEEQLNGLFKNHLPPYFLVLEPRWLAAILLFNQPPMMKYISSKQWLDAGDPQVEAKIKMCQVRQLTTLDLSGLNIDSLPPQVYQMNWLERLDLSDNQLTSLSEQLHQLENLRQLIVCTNRLSELPDSLELIHTLEEIDISQNHFDDIPSVIFHLPKLKRLVVNHNDLSKVADQFDTITQLEHLELVACGITKPPSSLFTLTSLRHLDLSANQLTVVPAALVKLENLEYLDLAENKIES